MRGRDGAQRRTASTFRSVVRGCFLSLPATLSWVSDGSRETLGQFAEGVPADCVEFLLAHTVETPRTAHQSVDFAVSLPVGSVQVESGNGVRCTATRWAAYMRHAFSTPRLVDASLVFAAALLVRVVYLVGFQGDPFAHDLVSNPDLYDELGRDIAAGGALSPASGAQPLYPYLVAALYAVVAPSPLVVRVVQMVLGALTAALLTGLTGSLVGRREGLVAGALWTLYWPAVLYAGELLPDTIVTALVVLALALSWTAVHRGGWCRWAGAGVVLALAALAKPNVLPLALVPPLAVLVAPDIEAAVRRRRALLASLVPVIALSSLIVGPALFEDTGEGGGSPVGKILWDGNHRFSDGTNPFVGEYLEVAHWPEWQHKEDTAAVSRACLADLRAFVADEPARFAALQARKALAYLSSQEVGNNLSPRWRRERSPWLRLPLWLSFGALLSLGCAAVVPLAPRWRGFVLPLLWLAGWSASVVAILVSGRLRLPGAALMCVPAAVGAVSILDAVRRRDGRALAPLLALVAAGALVSTVDWLQLRHHAIGAVLQMEAQVLERAGDVEGAEERYLAGIDLPRGGPRLQGSYALFLRRNGRPDEALSLLTGAVEREPGRAGLQKDLGAMLHDAGRSREALGPLEQAVALEPWNGGAQYNLGLVWLELDDPAAAARSFDAAEQLGVATGDLYHMRGLALARMGQLDRAELDLLTADELLPENCQVHANLGLLYEKTSRPDEARGAYARCPDDPRARRARCRMARDEVQWLAENCDPVDDAGRTDPEG